ncbi:MAG: phosphate ABC transporter substrate-binding protein [Promethearchaeota archaeon]
MGKKGKVISITFTVFISWTVIGIIAGEYILNEIGYVRISITGSATCFPVISQSAEEYMDDHNSHDIQVTGGGSSVGVIQVGEGIIDIGMSSRDIKSSEYILYPKLRTYTFAKDGIAVIIDADASHGVSQLTWWQLRGIFNGSYTKWNDIGGSTNDKIVVMGRDSASGTRASFEEILELKDDDDYANFKTSIQDYNSNGGVHNAVATNPKAIGYLGLGFLDSLVKVVAISSKDDLSNFTTPTIENIRAEIYPISRNLYMITNGKAEYKVQAFIDFILSNEGQKIVEKVGFIPLE